VPGVAVLLTASVRELTALDVPDKLAGENVPVTPDGTPEADNAMEGTTPFCSVLVTEILLELPAITLSEVLLADMLKLGVGMTIDSASEAVCPPPCAVTVRV
jgi:hypothetical protein